jgi:hypothetical protein
MNNPRDGSTAENLTETSEWKCVGAMINASSVANKMILQVQTALKNMKSSTKVKLHVVKFDGVVPRLNLAPFVVYV